RAKLNHPDWLKSPFNVQGEKIKSTRRANIPRGVRMMVLTRILSSQLLFL
ncbi:MAG: hypothetical protein ACI95X_002712, partial [Paraglaciecola sp.]